MNHHIYLLHSNLNQGQGICETVRYIQLPLSTANQRKLICILLSKQSVCIHLLTISKQVSPGPVNQYV